MITNKIKNGAAPTTLEHAPDAEVKKLKVMLRPGERIVFSVVSDAEYGLMNWAKNQAGERLHAWVRRELVAAGRAAAARANAAGHAGQNVNELVEKIAAK